jgi:hypothetical protein
MTRESISSTIIQLELHRWNAAVAKTTRVAFSGKNCAPENAAAENFQNAPLNISDQFSEVSAEIVGSDAEDPRG